MIIAISGAHGVGKTTVLTAIAPILNARVVTLPTFAVTSGLVPGTPARQCRDAAMSLGLVRGRLALLADCCAQIEHDRTVGGVALHSCCALDTAAHQGEAEAVLALCGDVRPDLVIVLRAGSDVLQDRLTARDGSAPDLHAIANLRGRYMSAARVATEHGWRVNTVDASRPLDQVVAEVLEHIRRVQGEVAP